MKKTLLTALLFIILSSSVFAGISWNPWLRHWTFEFEDGSEITLLFREDGYCYDEEGNQYGYVWKYDRILRLYRFPYQNEYQKLEIQVEEFDDNEENMSGYVIETGERITGEFVNNR